MLDETLSRLFDSQWLVLLTVSALLLALAEIGYRFGRRFLRLDPDDASGHSGSIQGAVLGLLGLLLGFTFAMSVGRYENRRELVAQEANSIGTTWLLADFLPSPQREEMKDLLKRYARHRLEVSAAAEDPVAFVEERREVAGLHAAMWEKARGAATAQPSPITANFIGSLTETFDFDSSRMDASRNHVPSPVWLLLMVVAGCGSWASGYATGTVGNRLAFSQCVFPLLIGVVVTLIVDIDRPERGLIGISQLPLEELIESMQP